MPNNWKPNSCPIGSDLMYETNDAFLHIEIKTADIKSKSEDFYGHCPISANQTSYHPTKSYKGVAIKGAPNLPEYYGKKPCLTYAIQTIYDSSTYATIAILLVCIPNGQLFNFYGNDIIRIGKLPKKSFSIRYVYRKNPFFCILNDKQKSTFFRVKFIYFNKKYYYKGNLITKEYITGRTDII